jgi:histidinol dehydrogenase
VSLLLRFQGPLAALPASDRAALFERTPATDSALRARVAEIITRVRSGGDDALRALARELDGVALESLEVPRERRRDALVRLEPGLRAALERTARNIETFHRGARPEAYEVETEPGVVVGRRPDPLDRVGIYAPGGRAAYPSTVLMCAVPARVAGVRERVLCTPPGPSGEPSDVVLAAAELAGVERVFALGGAGAIAALALGTATVPRVDRIVGPGNAYVAEAKLQLVGACSIDSPPARARSSSSPDATRIRASSARELLAQAEHDPLACAVAVAEGAALAERIVAALAAALSSEPRRAVIAEALAARGGVLVADRVEDAVRFAADYAPEHLLLVGRDAEASLARVRHAGTVFVGEHSSVAFGDYMTGANHTLPTGGLARSWSGLATLDFVRWTTWQRVTPAAAAGLAGDVATIATAEELPAHAAAARSAARSTARPATPAATQEPA